MSVIISDLISSQIKSFNDDSICNEQNSASASEHDTFDLEQIGKFDIMCHVSKAVVG